MASCPECGSENRGEARFCDSCGSPLVPASPVHESRRTVTVVFCDVTGSTALGERLDPESVRRVMTRYFDAMRAVLEHHGGTVEKFIGDAVMAVFGVPKVHEDDALRAVRAASEMRSALTDLNRGLESEWGVTIAARIGVNTGETVVGDPAEGQTLVTGDAVNVGARLEQAADPGEILLGAGTHRLVRASIRAEAVEPLTVKGKSEPIEAFRLLEVEPEGVATRHADAALVGRSRELRMVTGAFDHAVSDRACHLVTVLGVAGVGKSRLVAEAIAPLTPDALILSGRCLPYGDGITFWPLAEIIKQAAGIIEVDGVDEARSKILTLTALEDEGDGIAHRVCELTGLAPPGASLEQGFWATRKLFEGLARSRPLVVTIDDLQWAEPALLDLIEHVADWSRDAPIVLLCMARPEFLELRPGWGGGKMNAVSLLLEPLSAVESEALVANLLPGAELSSELRSNVLEASGGNPLFLEETLASLMEDGRLVREGETWRQTGDPAAVQVPPTIQALLAARLDRLGKEELLVIEGAAVVGQVFYRGAVSELAPEHLRPDVGTYLLGLVRKDLVRPDRSTFAGEETFRFRHLLIRDAAYQAMPKQTRAELHERFARWLETTAGDRLAEYEEIVGYHLEQAFRYREELGPVDEHGQHLKDEAGSILGRAGVRAAKRADHAAARSLLGRALSLRSEGSDAVDWLMRLGRAHHILGNTDEATRALEEAVARAESSQDSIWRWRARLALRRFRVFIDPRWSPEEARAMADAAISDLEAVGDDYGMALAWRLRGDAEAYSGRFAEWGRACQRTIEHALAVDDWSIQQAALGDFAQALVYGPTPVPEALDRCRQIVEESESRKEIRFWTLRLIGLLEAMSGHFDRSTALLAEAQAGYAELGIGSAYRALESYTAGQVDLLAGNPAQAAQDFRSALDSLKQSGDTGLDMPMAAALVAEALYRQGRDDEAEAYARESEQSSATDPLSRSMWRAVRAKILARRGEVAAAEELAREAVEISKGTDCIQIRGDLLLDSAEVLGTAGRAQESRQRILEALDLFERKGNVVSAARAQSLLKP